MRLDPEPKLLDEMLDEENARIRSERGENSMERALTPHLQDLAARLQKTLAQYEEEDRPAGGIDLGPEGTH